MLLALYRGTPSIRFPPAAGLWEAVYNLARMLASDRRLTWAAGSMPSKKRSGPSQATRHVAVAGILKILQPLPARDVSKKMFPPATLLKILRIVCARALQNRKLDPGVTEYKFNRAACVFHPKGPGQLRAPGPYQITKRLPAREGGEF